MTRAALLLILTAAAAAQPSCDDYYVGCDLQTETYIGFREPVTAANATVRATPFFSPDSSAATVTAFIEAAQTSVDIATPTFSSWGDCTPYAGCTGCAPAQQRDDEPFPVFRALLNALHRGVAVRILTLKYNTTDCAGQLSPLPFLALNGAQVRWYASTTYQHAKYMAADGKRIGVSSVNFSKTSYLMNREAGVVLEGAGAAPLVAFTQGVFEADWRAAREPRPAWAQRGAWSAAELAVIRNASAVPVVVPATPLNLTGYFETPAAPAPAADAGANWTVFASPDRAAATLLPALRAARRSLDVYVYQITEPAVCALLGDLHAAGVAVRVLVSPAIYDASDCQQSQACMANLTARGVPVAVAAPLFSFAHQKYWIRDGRTLGWSTGNLSGEDLPHAARPADDAYPPYAAPGGAVTNRDFSVITDAPSLVEVFQGVFDGDMGDPGVEGWSAGGVYCYSSSS